MIKLLLTLLAAFSFTHAYADAAKVKAALKKNYPQMGVVETVNKSNLLGLYEVIMQGQLFYTDEKAKYLISGQIFDLKTGRNLTEERSRKLFAVDFSKLPLELAVKKVKGNGQRKMAYFTDPHCGYCQKLEAEIKNLDNVTLYLFLYPVFQGSDVKVRNVLCSKDPVKAWDDLMLSNILPPEGSCAVSTDKVVELGRKLNVNGTPALIFADGVIVPGYMPLAGLEQALNGQKN